MNLRDLQYLVAVADNLHFGIAADSCHVSQPTLSMQLKKLENTLGVQLFERTNKSVLLTAIGKDITTRARLILEEAEQIRQIAKTAEDPLSGKITLGIFPTLAPYILPSLMPRLKAEFPRLSILLVEEKTLEIVRRLNNGEIDCALLAMPLATPGLTAYELFKEPFLLAVPATHRFAKHKSISLPDIRYETMLLLEDGHCLREQALDVCRMAGVADDNFRATSMATLLQMVAMGNHVTLIPKLATSVKNQSLRYIPFKNPIPSRTIGFYARSTSARAPLFEKISKLIKASYSKI